MQANCASRTPPVGNLGGTHVLICTHIKMLKIVKIYTIYSTVHSFAGVRNPLVPKVAYSRCRVCDAAKTNVNKIRWSRTKENNGWPFKTCLLHGTPAT
jgi:hypothetical protein